METNEARKEIKRNAKEAAELFRADFPNDKPDGNWDSECWSMSMDDLEEAINAIGYDESWQLWHDTFHACF